MEAKGKVIVNSDQYEKLKKLWSKISTRYTTVGVHNDAGNAEGDKQMTLPHLAAIHEFGVHITVTEKMRNYLAWTGLHLKKDTTEIVIPERAILRGWVAGAHEQIKKVTNGLVEKMLNDTLTPVQAIGQLGEFAVEGVKRRMKAGLEPPLNDYTLERRKHGGSKPLIDTSQLIGSITHKEVFGERPEGI